MNIRLGKQLIAAIAVFSIGLFLFLDTTAQSGGPYEIKSSVIGGGGGISCSTDPCAGATYSLTGTIGQAVAGGPAASGSPPYSLYHGFWQTTPGAGGWALSGVVQYGTDETGPFTFVPGVLLSAVGTPMVSDSSDAGGAYSIFGLGSGTYTVTPTKSDQVNGISNADAGQVAQHVAGFLTLTANKQFAGDTSGNGSLSNADAGNIARFAAGLTPVAQTGSWRFQPVSRTYPTIPGDLAGENYLGFLRGEVTGNWNPAGPPLADPGETGKQVPVISSAETVTYTPSSFAAGPNVAVNLPPNSGAPAGTVGHIIPINSGDVTGRGVLSFDLRITYDPNVLAPNVTPFSQTGTISDGCTVTLNFLTPGLIFGGAFCNTERTGSGALLLLRFNVNPGAPNGAQSPLTWTAFQPPQTPCPPSTPGFCYEEGNVVSTATSGLFTVGPLLASDALVSGRVVDADGRTIMRALVTLTGPDGSTRTVSTGMMGTFRFPNVSTGRTYVLSVGAKNRTFAAGTQLITVLDDATGIVFIADSPPKQ